MSKTRITTATGSEYVIREDNGRFFLSGDNVPNPNSGKLPAGEEWEIAQPTPWPPEMGRRMWMDGDGFEPRIPGGGKYTTPVMEIEVIE